MGDAPFHDEESFFEWLRNLAPWEQDTILDHRGPKGRGKSNGMAYIMFRTDATLTPQEALLTLCYNQEQYAKRYRALREERRIDQNRPKFIWGDDADQLFDRRGHGTRGNRAMLGLVRKARDQLRAIQQLGTQDDFLEGPLSVGGTFVRLIYATPGEAKVYWPRRDKMLEGITNWDYVFTLVFPDPNGQEAKEPIFTGPWPSYHEFWTKGYQPERRRLTSDGTTDLLLVLDPNGPERQSLNPTLKDAIVAEWNLDQKAPVTELVRRLRAKGTAVSYNYARDVVSTHRATTTNTGNEVGTDTHGEQGVLPAPAAEAP